VRLYAVCIREIRGQEFPDRFNPPWLHCAPRSFRGFRHALRG
jgi:hypothetical protein